MEFLKSTVLEILSNQQAVVNAALSANERSSLFEQREQLIAEFGIPVNDVGQAAVLERKLAAPGASNRLAILLSERATNDVEDSAGAIMSAIFTNQAGTLFTRTGKSANKQNCKVSLEKKCPNIMKLVKGTRKNISIYHN